MSRIKSLLTSFVEAGLLPTDNEEERLKKSSLTVMAGPFAITGLLWGVLYFSQGLMIPGAIPFCYGILSIVSIAHFNITKKFKFFRNSQLVLILILPFSLQLSLGGFIPSSGVILWAIIAPMAALAFFSARQSLGWFVAYIALVIVAYLVNDELYRFFDWGISEDFINVIFLMNIVSVSSLVYLIQYYFVGGRAKLKEAVEDQLIIVKEQSDQLKEMDDLKTRFFTNVSHEFRTPLTLILGILNKNLGDEGKDVSADDQQTMKRNADRLLQLINQLLDVSKLESGQVELNKETVDLVPFIRQSALLFGSAADEKQIEFTFNDLPLTETPDQGEVAVSVDLEQMQKVFTNLFSNALKFTPIGGAISISIKEDNKLLD